MHDWFYATNFRSDAVRNRRLRLTVALSVLVHLAALLLLPRVRALVSAAEVRAETGNRLEVQLTEASKPEAALTMATPSLPVAPVRRTNPRPAPRHPPAAPMAALVPSVPAAPAVSVPAPQPPASPSPELRKSPPPDGDLWSYIQAKRRERGEQPSSPSGIRGPDPDARLAANLPAPATGVAAQNRSRGGGMFEIRRMNYDDAAFEFFGWNTEMGRQSPQLIEVRLGNNSDMRIAVVRKVIAIIREHSQGDFVWRSAHREYGLTLSARPADNAELESFLLHDLFDDPRQSP